MTDSEVTGKEELLQRIQQSWEKFQAYLKTLTSDQLDKYTDAVG